MSNMFCFQCQQTAGNKGCVNTGVCGKQPETAKLQDELVEELIRLATAAHDAGKHSRLTDRLHDGCLPYKPCDGVHGSAGW